MCLLPTMRAMFHLFPIHHLRLFPAGGAGILCDIIIHLSPAPDEDFSAAGAAHGSTRDNELLVATGADPTFQASVYPVCLLDLIAAADGTHLRIIPIQEEIRAASGADVGSSIFFYPN